MSDKDWLFIGLLVGIPLGIGLLWFISQSTSSIATPKTYSNLEEWDIVKDERDRVIGLKVKREAESR